MQLPLRVDFGGGWRDVPKFSKPGTFIVNLTITPFVSNESWPYEKPGAGLGGSAAWRMLNGVGGVEEELASGSGWQDPAVIRATGLCVWRSGDRPVLEAKYNPDWLQGKMALLWTGTHHDCPSLVDHPLRDFYAIDRAGRLAKAACRTKGLHDMAIAIEASYTAQRIEGMKELPAQERAIAWKYCGAGHGGYALYLFAQQEDRDRSGLMAIEPYMRGVS